MLFIVLAGLDYRQVNGTQLTYNSTSTSASFGLTIYPDEITEQREFFEVTITNFTIQRYGTQIPLTDQERNRIQISVDRARVFITNQSGKNTALSYLSSLPPTFYVASVL